MSRMLRRLRYLIRAGQMERELREELDFHRANLDAVQRAGTHTPRTMGNVTLAVEDAREAWIWPWLQSVWQDVSYAARSVRRNPAFAAAVILVMALGIGTTTTVVSLLDALVFRSLPVHEPGRLVYFDRPSFSYPIYREVHDRCADLFSGLSAWDIERMHVEWSQQLEAVEVLTASGDFYATLGVEAAAGRTFTAADDRVGGGPDGRVAMLSHAAWQQRFGGEPGAIGRTIRIDQQPFTVIGVTAQGFFGVAPGLAPEITIPLTSLSTAGDLEKTSASWVHLVGRLRDGVSHEQAAAAVQARWPAVLDATSRAEPPDRRTVYLSRTTALLSARAGFSRVRNQFEAPLWILFAFVALLLAVACASATNLLLARSAARGREFAVRLAIGASRGRIARQLLTEALVWTLAAAAAGLLLARWGSAGLIAIMRTPEEPIVLESALDFRVLAFTIALAMLTGALCAIVPALRATRVPPQPALRHGREIGIDPRRRWSTGKVLVGTQVALTVVLLAGAGLFVRSLFRILSQDAGIDRARVLLVATEPSAAGYADDRLAGYYDSLLARLRAIPGVESASLSWYPPISDDSGHWTQNVGLDGDPPAADSRHVVYFNAVSPNYFRTTGMRLLRGRDVAGSDDPQSPRVVVVNDTLARRLFAGGGDALGRRITIGRNASRRDLEIVGVVSDAKYQRLQEPSRAIAYLPYTQLAEFKSGLDLVAEVRPRAGAQVAAEVRREAGALDGRVPLRIETVDDRIRMSLVRERVMTTLASGLGFTSLVLASVGLYGLLAFAVSRRTSEIGLRLALGAGRRQVVAEVVRQSLAIAAAGIACGVALTLAAGRLAQSALFQISPSDPVAIAGAAVFMALVSVCAALAPAWRASRVDPVVALRHE